VYESDQDLLKKVIEVAKTTKDLNEYICSDTQTIDHKTLSNPGLPGK